MSGQKPNPPLSPPRTAAEMWSSQLLLLDTKTLLPVFPANLDIAKRMALVLESLIKGLKVVLGRMGCDGKG